MNPFTKFVRNVLLSIDQFGNVLLFGSADETISARSYRKGEKEGHRGWKVMQRFVDTLFWFEKDHTKNAYEAEQARCHMPSDYHAEGSTCETPSKEDPK